MYVQSQDHLARFGTGVNVIQAPDDDSSTVRRRGFYGDVAGVAIRGDDPVIIHQAGGNEGFRMERPTGWKRTNVGFRFLDTQISPGSHDLRAFL